jgi:hypothetical protein
MLLLLVGGLDGPGDQGRGHMAVGQDPVVEAAQAEGVAEAARRRSDSNVMSRQPTSH